MTDIKTSSPTPYLIRAWHAWMQDNCLTPYLLVKVDDQVIVPQAHVQDGEIVLNISIEATGGLNLGNKTISFQARFSGKVHDISVPITCVASIFARETGQGMAFDLHDFSDEEAVFDLSADAYTYHADTTEPPELKSKTASGLSLVEKNSHETAKSHEDEAKSDTKPTGAAEKTDDKPPKKDGKTSHLRLID